MLRQLGNDGLSGTARSVVVALALLAGGVSLGLGVRVPGLGCIGLVLTAGAIATSLESARSHAALVLGSSLVASTLRFGFVWNGLRAYGAGDASAGAAAALCVGVGIVDRLPIAVIVWATPVARRALLARATPLWLPAAWLLGERGMAWVTTMALNGWLLTQAHTLPVVHLVSWIGQGPAAFVALTWGAAVGTALARRDARVLAASIAVGVAALALPARHTDARALRGVAALRLARRAEQVHDLDASLVVWPEAVSRRDVRVDEGDVDAWVSPPSTTPSTHVMGLLDRRGERTRNGAMVVTHDGHAFWYRTKTALAGMGEEARFGIRLGNAHDFVRGEIEPVVRIGERRVGVLLCSEVFDAEMRARATPPGVELVVVLAGDAITGDDASGRELMLAAAILAAAERGVAIARASMRGVAALIGPDGTVHARIDEGHLRAATMPTSEP